MIIIDCHPPAFNFAACLTSGLSFITLKETKKFTQKGGSVENGLSPRDLGTILEGEELTEFLKT